MAAPFTSCIRRCALAPPSTGRSFVKLASQRSFASTPILDFLAPSVAPHTRKQAAWRPSQRAASARDFSISSIKRETKVIYNPRQDEDGEDMNIEITPRAATRLKQIMNKEGNPNRALRIQVESGGCHGFQYLMSLTNIPPIDASAQQPMPTPTATPEGQDGVVKETTGIEKVDLSEDDTVFEADTGARVVMDGPSLELLKGSKVDYTVELIGSQFKIVDNPLATSSCGCGTSFDIKI